MIERETNPEALGKRNPIAFAAADGSKRLGYYCDSGRVRLGEDFRDGTTRVSSGRSLIVTNDGDIERPFLVANRYIVDVQQSVAAKLLHFRELDSPPFNNLDFTIGQELNQGRIKLPKIVGLFIDGREAAHAKDILTVDDPFKEIEETLQPFWDRLPTHLKNKLSLKGNLRATSIGTGVLKVKEEYL